MYDLLDDNGVFVLQVAGIRPHWQFEDLIWYLFLIIMSCESKTSTLPGVCS